MSKQPARSRAKTPVSGEEPLIVAPPTARRATRADTLIALMRGDGGATAAELGAAIGWQVHSVRGFIAGTLKKRSDLIVTTVRADGGTRYRVVDVEGGAS